MDLFTHVTAIASLAVVAVQQILKLNFIPLSFANKYPVPTNILLSIGAAIIAAWQSNSHPTTWTGWVAFVAVIAVVAAIIYNNTLRNWKELRDTESPGTK